MSDPSKVIFVLPVRSAARVGALERTEGEVMPTVTMRVAKTDSAEVLVYTFHNAIMSGLQVGEAKVSATMSFQSVSVTYEFEQPASASGGSGWDLGGSSTE